MEKRSPATRNARRLLDAPRTPVSASSSPGSTTSSSTRPTRQEPGSSSDIGDARGRLAAGEGHGDETRTAPHPAGHRGATVATATPIANSIAEPYVMPRHLRRSAYSTTGWLTLTPGRRNSGGRSPRWSSPHGGGGYRMHTRFAQFQNVPEMIRLWHVFADVKTADNSAPNPRARPAARRGAAAGNRTNDPGFEPLASSPSWPGGRNVSLPRGRPRRGQHADRHHRWRRAALDMRLVPASPPAGGQARARRPHDRRHLGGPPRPSPT